MDEAVDAAAALPPSPEEVWREKQRANLAKARATAKANREAKAARKAAREARAAEAPPPEPPAEKPAAPHAAAKKYRIILEENDNIPPGIGQYFGHNGRGWHLQAGREAIIPQEIKEILDHAIENVPIIEQGTKRYIGSKKKLRFPYRILEVIAA